MIKYIITGKESDCCGCRACEQICGKHAITMIANEEGFLYPQLNSKMCVQCGVCSKICPMDKNNLERILTYPKNYFAAQALDRDLLQQSSSGGMFRLFAEEILNEEGKGVVYGAAFVEDLYLKHIRVTTKDNLQRMQGSKYLQSDTEETFANVERDLCEGLKVYYVGTPCQIAGLKLFLHKEYANLLTSDLVCHGTPSYKVFRNSLNHIESKYRGTILNYSFRDKRVMGWSCSSSSSFLRTAQGWKSLKFDTNMQAYFNAFISGDLMRYSCYNCHFACNKRVGDITLADHWGVNKYNPNFPNIQDGVSLLLVNTPKGRLYWENLKDKTTNISVKQVEALESNPNLNHPTPFTNERKEAYVLAFSDYQIFLNKYKPKIMGNVISHLRYVVRRIRPIYMLYRWIRSL